MRFGKRDVFIAGILLTALFTGSFVLLPPSAITGMFVVEMLRQFAYGLTIPLLWAMMADVADYSEWRNCRRATGMVFSANVFGLKAGLGLGSAITGYVLNAFGYIPNAPQTIRSLQGIRLAMSLFPSVTFALCAICLLFYGIDKNIELRVNEELASRRIGPGFQSTAVA